MLAWAHIYLGRIFDVEDRRDQAVAEYKAALTARDGQPDTKAAAETGLKTPFILPHRTAADAGQGGSLEEQAPGAGTPPDGNKPAPPPNPPSSPQ
jgi:hypothetical protein